METINLATANQIQNLSVKFTEQNNNIKIAVNALKSITHDPLAPLTTEAGTVGITAEDRKVINDFVKLLESREVSMYDVFNSVLANVK